MTKAEEEAYGELKEMLAEESWAIGGECARLHRQLPRELETLVMDYARPRYRKPKHAGHIRAHFECNKEKEKECEFGLTAAALCFGLPPLILTVLRLWGGASSRI